MVGSAETWFGEKWTMGVVEGRESWYQRERERLRGREGERKIFLEVGTSSLIHYMSL